MDEINNWDILSQLATSTNQSNQNQTKALASMDKSLKDILNNLNKMSASNARNQMGSSKSSRKANQDATEAVNKLFGKAKSTKSLADAIEKGIMDELLGEDFRKSMNGLRDKFKKQLEDDLGVPFEELPNMLGESLGKQIGQFTKNTKLGKQLEGRILSPLKDRSATFADTLFKSYNQRMAPFRGRNTASAMPDVKAMSTAKAREAVEKESEDSISYSEMSIAKLVVGSLVISNKTESAAENQLKDAANKALNNDGTMSDISDVVSPDKIADIFGGEGEAASAATDALADFATSGEGADAMLSALEGGLGDAAAAATSSAGATVMLASSALAALDVLDNAGEALTSFIQLFGALGKAANRDAESRKKNQELAQKRLEADIKTLIETPFEILNQAAQEWYDAWDKNLRTITATQGYNKSDLQDLMSEYANRLREENLSSVVDAADISNNLAKVLESGLSGAVAEEFAYEATKLNAAVPTQDFFSYAETYASIAANAIVMGKSREEAIAYANEEIEKFASSVLYASRELSGGFSTGLKDAQSLFKQSAQIAQTSKLANASDIAGVMTAVSAITGAIAPDLATSMTDLIYKAATGGNSADIVALRSLAGINASNTEFLRRLATNPEEVFTALFENLGSIQKMSPDAFMEAAEGLSSVFGVSMEALTRIDFNYLATAISNMNTSNSALEENMDLLISGETTTNAELLRMQQINQYMIDEGLSYVLDNEAARAIQQHMWDEQRDRQLMEATYGVELEGAALTALERLGSLVDSILGFLIPAYGLAKLISKGVNAVATAGYSASLKNQIGQVLDLGKVGSASNVTARTQLTQRNRDYDLIDSLSVLMGGTNGGLGIWNGVIGLSDFVSNPVAMLADSIGYKHTYGTRGYSGSRKYSSAYNWNLGSGSGIVGKSLPAILGATGAYATGTSVSGISAMSVEEQMSATEKAQEAANQSLQNMVNSMQTFIDENKGANYEDWVATAKNFGIADFTAAVDDANMTSEALENQFTQLMAQAGTKEEVERKQREEKFWENNTKLLTENSMFLDHILEQAMRQFDLSNQILNVMEDYLREWEDYYINHTVYSNAYSSDMVKSILTAEKDKSETAIYALADALTENGVDLLVDPTLQTNALLAEILKVANALLNQRSSGAGGVSLAETIAGLSLGIVK